MPPSGSGTVSRWPARTILGREGSGSLRRIARLFEMRSISQTGEEEMRAARSSQRRFSDPVTLGASRKKRRFSRSCSLIPCLGACLRYDATCHCLPLSYSWIPAFAGMTGEVAGMAYERVSHMCSRPGHTSKLPDLASNAHPELAQGFV